MKTIHPILLLLAFVTGLMAQSPPAPPAVAPPSGVVPLTGITPPATAPATNALPTVPAFPAFPTLPSPRRAAVPAAPPANPGNVANPVDPGANPPAPANNVAGRLAGGGAAAGGNGAAAKPDDSEVFEAGLIKFNDASVLQVLEVYQDLTERTVLRPTTLPDTKISVRSQTRLTRKEAVQLLDTILAMNQITMIPQGEKFVKAVPQGQAGVEAPMFTDPDAPLDETTHYITQIVQLKNALPREVAPMLQPLAKMPAAIIPVEGTSILVLRDYEENIKRMMELLEKIDVTPMNEYQPIVIPIKYALASDIAQVLSSLTAGGGGATTVGGRPAGTGLSTTPGMQGSRGGAGGFGGTAGGFGGATGVPGQPGYGGNTAGGAGGLSGAGFGSPAASRSSFQDRLRSIVNRAASGAGDIVVLSQTKIIADERTNSLLIFATKGDIETIKDIISKLDVVLAQVIIEAIVMEVSLDNNLNYGFSYLQKNPAGNGYVSGIGAINNGTILNTGSFRPSGTNAGGILASGFSYFARFGNDFDATATAVATDNRINVLSRPRIQTSHAVEANLFVGETRPYITGTYSYYGSGPSSQYSQLQIGITLSVLPLINQDGLVVMDIRQKIQSIGGTTKIDNNDIPITIDREANAKVAVQTGETVMLGGFISTDRSKSASGVPLLKDLPVFGPLFRSTSKSLSRKELMVLIRPTVLPTPAIAALVAKQETAKLPGITAATRDAARDERRQTSRLRADDVKDQQLLEEEERKDQKKVGAEQLKQKQNTDQDIYRKEGFLN